MNDSFFVRRGQPMRDLPGVIESLAHRDRSTAQPLPQGLALKQLRHHVRRALARANVKHSQNIGMIQCSSRQRLLLKATHPVSIERKRPRQYLDCDFAPETRIPGAINLAHSAST